MYLRLFHSFVPLWRRWTRPAAAAPRPLLFQARFLQGRTLSQPGARRLHSFPTALGPIHQPVRPQMHTGQTICQNHAGTPSHDSAPTDSIPQNPVSLRCAGCAASGGDTKSCTHSQIRVRLMLPGTGKRTPAAVANPPQLFHKRNFCRNDRSTSSPELAPYVCERAVFAPAFVTPSLLMLSPRYVNSSWHKLLLYLRGTVAAHRRAYIIVRTGAADCIGAALSKPRRPPISQWICIVDTAKKREICQASAQFHTESLQLRCGRVS